MTTVEIERKFLVSALPADFAERPRSHLRQGYVAITEEGVEVRVRAEGGAFTLTVKSAGGAVRTEVEIEIDAERFEALWPLTGSRRVEKRRTRYALDAATAEVDEYAGALSPLRVVEVEFATLEAARAFVPPPWFGAEVTDDARYRNRNLALRGLPAP